MWRRTKLLLTLFFSKMTNRKHIRDLYRRSLIEKWDLPIEDLDILKYCPFCEDKKSRGGSGCATNGKGCAHVCLIDKTICGSKGSLMDILADFYEDRVEFDGEMYPPEYIEMIEKVRKAIRKKAKIFALIK